MSKSDFYHKDIIVAPASPLGGAVVMLRISGDGVTNRIKGIFATPKGSVESFIPRHLYFGYLYEEDTILDEVTLVYYKAPYSYTGEDTLEITCHASSYIVSHFISLLLQRGIRMAEPGEFTFRSYLNGKRDMAEAEAVADLIAAESKAQLQLALSQLQGELSKHLADIRTKLLRFTSLIELELDFSEEDVEFADRKELTSLCLEILKDLSRLIDSYDAGRKIKKGVQTALVGIPNSGKSSLLNYFLGENRAIVSNIAGTTRDAISEMITIEGIPFRLIDTAGLRETEDPIEKLGVSKSREYLSKSDLALLLLDATCLEESPLDKQLELLVNDEIRQKTIILLNKIDLLSFETQEKVSHIVEIQTGIRPILISISQNIGLKDLKKALLDYCNFNPTKGEALISNIRHKYLLEETYKSLNSLLEDLERGLSGDLLTSYLHKAILSLGEITGDTITSDDVLHNIFAHFCIGK